MSFQKRYTKGFTMMEIMIVVAIIGIIIAIAVPGYIRARANDRIRSCQANLRNLDGAKEQYALERNITSGAEVSMSDIAPADGTGYLRAEPKEPAGFKYSLNAIGEDPTCDSDYPGHSIAEIGQVITEVEG